MNWKGKTCELCIYRGTEGYNFKVCMRFPPNEYSGGYSYNANYPVVGCGSYKDACAEYKEKSIEDAKGVL